MKREKVIKALEICFNPTGKCKECPYDELGEIPNCTKAVGKDALELLKAWDPLAPEIEGGSVTWWWVCGECHGEVGSRDKYCRHCGREIAWDEVQLQRMRTEDD